MIKNIFICLILDALQNICPVSARHTRSWKVKHYYLPNTAAGIIFIFMSIPKDRYSRVYFQIRIFLYLFIVYKLLLYLHPISMNN